MKSRAIAGLRYAAAAGLVTLALVSPWQNSTALLTDVATGPAIAINTWTGCSSSAYRSAVLSTSPDAYLRLSSASATEPSLGSVTTPWSWTGTPSAVASALGCDANSAARVDASLWLSSEAVAAIAADSSPFSYAFWFRASAGSQGVLMSSAAGRLAAGSAVRGDRATWITPSGLLGVVVSDGPSTRWITTSTTVTDGAWHFVVVTLQVTDVGTGRGTRLYLDGNQVAFGSQMRKGLTPAAGESWRLGPASLSADLSALAPTTVFAGSTDELAVWSRTLTSTEVAAMWAARNG